MCGTLQHTYNTSETTSPGFKQTMAAWKDIKGVVFPLMSRLRVLIALSCFIHSFEKLFGFAAFLYIPFLHSLSLFLPIAAVSFRSILLHSPLLCLCFTVLIALQYFMDSLSPPLGFGVCYLFKWTATFNVCHSRLDLGRYTVTVLCALEPR